MIDGSYHDPVMLNECMDGLSIDPKGIYVDMTFGGGGHSKSILQRLGANGQLFAFDQDADAWENKPFDDRLTLIQHNFRYVKKYLRLYGVKSVDGILADLGVSSHQFDTADRGFSFRFDAALDMRMNQSAETTAATILNTYNAEKLQQIFSEYGELRNSKSLAIEIVRAREKGAKMKTIEQFLQVMEPCIRGKRNRYISQVFQALRIEVNQEMESLKEMLTQCVDLLKPGGRLVVMSYHSLEDRLTKLIMRNGNFSKTFEADDFGHIYRPFKLINKKIITPTQEECERNPRARSAKLRIAQRTEMKRN